MMLQATDVFTPGDRVRVTQQIPQRQRVWTTQTIGTVERFERMKTGSWFARAKDDKLWLDRLTVRKDDGERVVVHLDPYTHVERLTPGSAPGSADPSAAHEGEAE